MIEDIMKKVSSPFNDAFIANLVERYVNCGCDDRAFYSEINDLDNNPRDDENATKELIKRIHSIGQPRYPTKFEDNYGLYYDESSSFVILYSSNDPMNENVVMPGENKYPLLYRFYLNLTGKEKTNLIEQYLIKCEEEKLPFQLKFSTDDSRADQIIISSSLDNFEKIFSILEELVSDKKLGEVPTCIGKHENGIGITEEYFNRLFSPTQVRLALVRSSIKKYLCDHYDDIYDQFDDAEKKELKKYYETFAVEYESAKQDKELFGDEFDDKDYYQKLDVATCYKEHMDDNHDAYCCGDGIVGLAKGILRIYSDDPQNFISEVIQNYRRIGTQVWGFSANFVFSNETEKVLEAVRTKSVAPSGADEIDV